MWGKGCPEILFQFSHHIADTWFFSHIFRRYLWAGWLHSLYTHARAHTHTPLYLGATPDYTSAAWGGMDLDRDSERLWDCGLFMQEHSPAILVLFPFPRIGASGCSLIAPG